jgi:hypothetical protein
LTSGGLAVCRVFVLGFAAFDREDHTRLLVLVPVILMPNNINSLGIMTAAAGLVLV